MKRAAAMAFVVLASVSCGSGEPVASPAPATSEPVLNTSDSPAPVPATGTATAAPGKTAPPAFAAKVTKVSRDRLPYSWRSGCPVHFRDLRLITMTYWGFDGKPHTGGELVVRKTVTDDIVTVMKKLYDWRWPIKQMKLVDAYKGDDFDSIDADNTSAFNCRPATGSSNWSNHAYGEAIDINPRENPYVTASGSTAHQNAKKFTKRPLKGKGVVNPRDRVVKAFAQVGWEWGGYWSGTKDYQHFSKGGG
ncbi:D-alanyl-D-alanine carboxypeptidase [Nonomuraea solani]|uniref:D-alanyl-D-alanine carboxypeptidase n=1 Tax=Nonomuraea solani TaxID=1144553 RepID=A0A1H6CVH2_9ACTN|nr:M15 family metallopeptidase [Nonomuraea solani]SEG77030.1 D-alanyl-D-alanine carboxypeptidase [Nonomuraea solani]